MTATSKLSAKEIGYRLRLARESAGLRQEDAAQTIGASRPTLISIEQGARRVRIQELQRLAHRYGLSASALLRREAVHTDLLPRFRKLRGTNDAHKQEAARLLNNLVRAEVELENLLGIQRRRNYPPGRSIAAGDAAALAEKHAGELRDWLGLGPGPIADIFSTIELDLGIRLYQRRLSRGSKVAGLFAHDESVGACILLNANHPLPRRIQSAAHELGHFYATREIPEVLQEDEKPLSRAERYANSFGHAFLAPAEGFAQSFRQLQAGTDKITRRMVVLLAHQYGISRQACCLRLEETGCAKKGTWKWFKDNGGITDEQIREVLGTAAGRPDPAAADADSPVPHRTSLMAHTAWKRGLMSEGVLAELLKVGRVQLRDIFYRIEIEESEAHGLLKRTA